MVMVEFTNVQLKSVDITWSILPGWTKTCYFLFKMNISWSQHLFFKHWVAIFMWSLVHVAFNLSPSLGNISHILENWTLGLLGRSYSGKTLVGARVICWSAWLCLGDAIVDNQNYSSNMVIFIRVILLRLWPALQRANIRGAMSTWRSLFRELSSWKYLFVLVGAPACTS